MNLTKSFVNQLLSNKAYSAIHLRQKGKHKEHGKLRFPMWKGLEPEG